MSEEKKIEEVLERHYYDVTEGNVFSHNPEFVNQQGSFQQTMRHWKINEVFENLSKHVRQTFNQDQLAIKRAKHTKLAVNEAHDHLPVKEGLLEKVSIFKNFSKKDRSNKGLEAAASKNNTKKNKQTPGK